MIVNYSINIFGIFRCSIYTTHGSRGIQILSCLYAFNCPTFLFSYRRWKLFVENEERNTVLMFPFNNDSDHSPHVNSSLLHEMGSTFLKAIVICILSKRPSLIQGTSSKKPISKTRLNITQTPTKNIVKAKYFSTPTKPQRQSRQLKVYKHKHILLLLESHNNWKVKTEENGCPCPIGVGLLLSFSLSSYFVR